MVEIIKILLENLYYLNINKQKLKCMIPDDDVAIDKTDDTASNQDIQNQDIQKEFKIKIKIDKY